MDSQDWKKFKRSGGYRRKVKKVYDNMVINTPTTSTATSMFQNDQADTNNNSDGSVNDFMEEEHEVLEISE